MQSPPGCAAPGNRAAPKLKLKEIRHSDIQGFVARMSGKKTSRGTLSANTIRKIVTMLKSIFKSAVKNDLIRTNPAADLEIPTVIKAKIEPPSKKDVLAILQQAPVEYRTIFLLDALTGLRRGEVLALRWRDMLPIIEKRTFLNSRRW